MSQFKIREKATGNVIACDWQNAFELVNHGFWEWASGNGQKEFQKARNLARNAPAPEGFDREVPLEDATDDDDDIVPVVAPAPVKTVEQIATTVIPPTPVVQASDKLEDMTRDELFAHSEAMGLTVDKRTGTKNLISAIRAAQEAV